MSLSDFQHVILRTSDGRVAYCTKFYVGGWHRTQPTLLRRNLSAKHVKIYCAVLGLEFAHKHERHMRWIRRLRFAWLQWLAARMVLE